ncbi:hypothetical protein INS49_007152 [Diaporthe citri]|uniref:uncharacterized protein n=1 Tax=Diaporthe citri TaxID=83186 RepID=UPI001C7E7A14|nr:uncharacterized protein INS49_007152 [Diaporthe citri]KAG6365541.1 hypothetical protein INS49_007152 [Diaporthe citri]
MVNSSATPNGVLRIDGILGEPTTATATEIPSAEPQGMCEFASCVRSGSECSYYDHSASTGEQSDCRDGDARFRNAGIGAQSRGRDTSEPLSSNEEADASFGVDAFTTTLFSGTPADVSEKNWWLFRARIGPGEHLRLPIFTIGSNVSVASSAMESKSQWACLVRCEHYSTDVYKTNPDALSAVVMHLNGLVTAANHHWGPMVTTKLTILQKFLGMAIGCVTRNDVQGQLSSMVSSVNQCALPCVLFISLSPKPTDAWWCVDKNNKSARSNCGPASLLGSTRGQQQDLGFANARMIAYMYLSLVLRPGRMSNEILECLMDSVSTVTEGFERRAVDDSAEQAAVFWTLMLSRAAMASMTPMSGSGPEKLYWKQRLIDQNIRSASAMLQLQTWPEAVAVLRRAAFAEFEGERELKSMWERAISDVD